MTQINSKRAVPVKKPTSARKGFLVEYSGTYHRITGDKGRAMEFFEGTVYLPLQLTLALRLKRHDYTNEAGRTLSHNFPVIERYSTDGQNIANYYVRRFIVPDKLVKQDAAFKSLRTMTIDDMNVVDVPAEHKFFEDMSFEEYGKGELRQFIQLHRLPVFPDSYGSVKVLKKEVLTAYKQYVADREKVRVAQQLSHEDTRVGSIQAMDKTQKPIKRVPAPISVTQFDSPTEALDSVF